MQAATFLLRVMVLAKEVYWGGGGGGVLINVLIRQRNDGNKEQRKAEMQRRKCKGKRNLEISSLDSNAGGEPVVLGPGPPRATPPPVVPRQDTRHYGSHSRLIAELLHHSDVITYVLNGTCGQHIIPSATQETQYCMADYNMASAGKKSASVIQ